MDTLSRNVPLRFSSGPGEKNTLLELPPLTQLECLFPPLQDVCVNRRHHLKGFSQTPPRCSEGWGVVQSVAVPWPSLDRGEG